MRCQRLWVTACDTSSHQGSECLSCHSTGCCLIPGRGMCLTRPSPPPAPRPVLGGRQRASAIGKGKMESCRGKQHGVREDGTFPMQGGEKQVLPRRQPLLPGAWQPATLQSWAHAASWQPHNHHCEAFCPLTAPLSEGLEGLQEAEVNPQAALFSRRGECIFPHTKWFLRSSSCPLILQLRIDLPANVTLLFLLAFERHGLFYRFLFPLPNLPLRLSGRVFVTPQFSLKKEKRKAILQSNNVF